MKKLSSTFASMIITVSIALFSVAASAQSGPAATGLRRTDLQQHDLSTPGREVVQVRVDFGPGVVAPRHKHYGEEVIYVLEGTLEYQVEGQPPVTLKAGGVLFVPAGKVHGAKNVGKGAAAELATYIVEKGKPLSVMVK